ncbi:cytochrome c oxidase assembly factor Coa1 family protein [Corallococcus sp. bb12-1]|uniref:cytochrome c oxidase assembly factor Coa1 family protein n=1 Tax=Corallococcus sp. bb12-1 TaxID=2996784 RepID=UPI002270C73D|nr:cytochrome c oxidase assembly factor Coa1 family protein [Corallococcus sp. bb12-1]MCY1045637.1 cytochrome c oxidase assembly factor Coa1 family protein [Corallococcus sp. bb12-1]
MPFRILSDGLDHHGEGLSRSRGRSMGLFLVVLTVIVVGFLLTRSTLPHEEALERVAKHPSVIQALGAPIHGAFFFSNHSYFDQHSGHHVTQMRINLSGSKQDGVLQVKAFKTGTLWGFSNLRVVAKDGRVVTVVGSY